MDRKRAKALTVLRFELRCYVFYNQYLFSIEEKENECLSYTENPG